MEERGYGWPAWMVWFLSDYWLSPVSCTGMLTELSHAWQIQIALAVLVQAISLAGAFELQVLLVQGNAGDFMDSVSLRLVLGILCWIILLQWYRMNGPMNGFRGDIRDRAR